MPIWIDTSEAAITSKLPWKEMQCTAADQLEAITGADLMLTLAPYPATSEMLIRKHIEQGALLVQRKSGLDLAYSVGERLNSSLARMHEVHARQAQCVLLTTGNWICNLHGDAVLGGNQTSIKYMDLLAGISKWHDRGGVVEQIVDDLLIPAWCTMKLKHLQEYRDQPTKEVWQRAVFPDDPPRADDSLQLPVRVRDWRRWFTAMVDGIGPGAGNALRDAMLAAGATDTGLTALLWATDMHGTTPRVPGWGKRRRQQIREALMGADAEFVVIDFHALPPIEGKAAEEFYGQGI